MTIDVLSDRELDAWLAKHLFSVQRRRQLANGSYEDYQRPPYLDEIPSPSTGDGMLLVLEAMRERGWAIEVTSASLVGAPPGPWVVSMINRINGNRVDGDADNSTSLPRAVAEAAKAALTALA